MYTTVHYCTLLRTWLPAASCKLVACARPQAAKPAWVPGSYCERAVHTYLDSNIHHHLAPSLISSAGKGCSVLPHFIHIVVASNVVTVPVGLPAFPIRPAYRLTYLCNRTFWFPGLPYYYKQKDESLKTSPPSFALVLSHSPTPYLLVSSPVVADIFLFHLSISHVRGIVPIKTLHTPHSTLPSSAENDGHPARALLSSLYRSPYSIKSWTGPEPVTEPY